VVCGLREKAAGILRACWASVWLGWQAETNWTRPLYYLLYSLVEPVSAALILVVMYMVITGGRTHTELFVFLFIGNAFFSLVSRSLGALTMVVHSDRDHYEVMRYVYISPMNFLGYFLGRGAVNLLYSLVITAVVLVFGVAAFHLPISWGGINWLLFLPALVLGMAAALGVGILIAGVGLISSFHGFNYREAVSHTIYLLSGVLFPIVVLPGPLQTLSRCLPFTYWFEAMRRSCVSLPTLQTGLEAFSNPALLGMLAILTAILLLVAVLAFRMVEFLARRRGSLDLASAS